MFRDETVIKSRISAVRNSKKLTQLNLAIELGIDPAQLRRIEGVGKSKNTQVSKYISVDILNKLCFLFECQPGDLFVYEPDEVKDAVQTV